MTKLPRSGYATASESAKPGYLKRKFDKIRQDMKRAKDAQEKSDAEAKAKVSLIVRAK
jgi:hypothetical protein